MASTSLQDAWVARVLRVDGVAAAGPARSGAAHQVTPLTPIWRDAKDGIDAQVGRMQDALRGTRNPLGRKVADAGLNGFSGKLQVGLMAALMDYDAAGPETRPAATGKVLGAVEAARKTLATSVVLRVLEANPFGIRLSIRGDFDAALARIQQAIRLT